MKKIFLALLLLSTYSLSAFDCALRIGPHFNYTCLDFNNPHQLEGYMGGVTVEGELSCFCVFTKLDFEGSWNAGRFTGDYCQKSCLKEYFVNWQIGYACCWQNINFRPYLGFGWNRFENEQDPDTAHLCYKYDKYFIPVGVYAETCFCENMSAGVQLEWRPDVHACLELWGVDLGIKCEHAFRVQVPLRYSCGCFCIELKPYYDWNLFGRLDERGPCCAYLDIPELTRRSGGARLLIGYQY